MGNEHTTPSDAIDPQLERMSPQGTAFAVAAIHEFILSAFREEALHDRVVQLQVECVEGKITRDEFTQKLRPMIGEVVAAASDDDWSRAVDDLLAVAEEFVGSDTDDAPDHSCMRPTATA